MAKSKVMSEGLLLIILLTVLLLGVGIALLSLDGKDVGPDQIAEHSLVKLQSDLYRVLLAEEVAVDDELEKSTTQLEQTLTTLAADPKIQGDPRRMRLIERGTKVLSDLDKSDRKSAIEALVEFSSDMDEQAAEQYRKTLKSGPRSNFLPNLFWGSTSGVPWLLLGILLIAYVGTFLMFLRLRLWTLKTMNARDKSQILIDTELQEAISSLEEERKHTTSLQQKNMELANKLKVLELVNEEKSKNILNLEVNLKAARISAQSLETSTKEIVTASQHDAEVFQKQSESLRSEISNLREELRKSKESSQGEIQDLRAQNLILSRKLEDSLAKPAENEMQWEQKLQEALLRQKSAHETEQSMLEWKNTKLETERESLRSELATAKEELQTQMRHYRTRVTDAELEFEKSKKQALRDLEDRYATELRQMREDYRAATQELARLKETARTS